MRIPRISLALSMAFTVPLVLATPATAVAAAAAERPGSAGARAERPQSESYELLQLNLCLSGLAGCYNDSDSEPTTNPDTNPADDTIYPEVVDEAIATIQALSPDAVTVNEACSGDIERIAKETGYDFEFATVIYNNAPLPCRNPGGRGVFGNAVLAEGEIVSSEDEAFEAQLGSEERRWLCVVTDDDVRVCTTHLSVAGTEQQAATNEAQCKELTALLRENGQRQATILGGDVNRQQSCAPGGFWTVTDAAAEQAPGIQHVYGSRGWLRQPDVEVVPMTYTDHDALLATATLRHSGGQKASRAADRDA